MEILVDAVLLTLLVVITLAILFQRNLFAVVLLAGAYSFLMASIMLVLDAVDVAMTEAAVGAGISTALFLATLYLTHGKEYLQPNFKFQSILVVVLAGGMLIWGMWDMPEFGVMQAPLHENTAPGYLDASKNHLMPPNVVTAVLADYRSFDTLGETTVIFTAGIGVLLILRGRKKPKKSKNKAENSHEA
ncbi:MAG: DUF4040 domain-containing protein [Paracoccaceae bacterium]|jgi:multicomponent Na+:H+ antiporter subunit B|nr:MAG: hypothetical protein ABR99_00955 [Rhodobacter sp. BACL10 MAG-121220-bin24]KRO89443.1 MAG: hypothetical protein ABR89_13685 [Rhodobacter sp. BACL10 MAG-120910-bin24]KRP25282.1 MAG: hypothetical protein ABR97_07385 [Rhodobacter sp. BACL10 MAG-120419-bin15]MDO7568335.1 DUF4040 domain-containing protein [Paracoccaceae bacterium]HCB52677.1 cation:proton antiporter [Rhodobacter sp.]